MTKAELIKLHGVEWYEEYKATTNQKYKERYKNNSEFREHQKHISNNIFKERYKNDNEFRERKIEYQKEYKKIDLNEYGITKQRIRERSNRILFKRRHHAKLKGYEIHHCFGYVDPSKFIYIPRSLHIKIHQYLRDNNIDADSNHYDCIKYMINECEEYTYISI